jgi:hypothetical protein
MEGTRKVKKVESYKEQVGSIINKRYRRMETTGWTEKDANEDFLPLEKKAARKWNKENRRKERDRKNITPYLKGTYEIRQITEEEKIERK